MSIPRHRSGHDACAIMAHVHHLPGRSGVQRVIEGLRGMEHRAGRLGAEGDGVGLHLDLPRALWAERVGKSAHAPEFFVGHLFVPASAPETIDEVRRVLADEGVALLHLEWHPVDSDALGPAARRGEPFFVQLGCSLPLPEEALDAAIFRLQLRLERESGVHVVSLSRHAAVYKVHGLVDTLLGYYPDLRRDDLISAITLGHGRFSTNTMPAFERVQPAAVLAHNGEINTIDRLRREAKALGLQLTRDGSDSQDLDRVLHHLLAERGLSLFAGMEVTFPPVPSEQARLEPALQGLYAAFRRFWGPFAQGPAGLLARWEDEACFAVDALGLRPLWVVPTEEGLYVSSERACLPFSAITADPWPLSPGEKLGARVRRGQGVTLFAYPELQQEILAELAGGHAGDPAGETSEIVPLTVVAVPELPLARRIAAHGFGHEDLEYAKALAATGEEPIGSLGYDGPLAALSPSRQALADYCKESVAVVTNPAIDRQREAEHFDTRAELGPRPQDPRVAGAPASLLAIPVVLEAARMGWLPGDRLERVTEAAGTVLLEALAARFVTRRLACSQGPEETLGDRLEALAQEAATAVESGCELLVLDDADAFSPERLPVDPHLALSCVDRALRGHPCEGGTLRRRCSVVLESGALRNLHDLMLALSLGADVLAPHLLLEAGVLAAEGNTESRLSRMLSGLAKGFEKVISTMGTHELRGYGRTLGAIGVAPEVVELCEIPGFVGSARSGLDFARLEADARDRHRLAVGEAPVRERRDTRVYPKLWRQAGQVACGEAPYEAYSAHVAEVERTHPVALRHLLDLRSGHGPVPPVEVDPSVDRHSYPFVISAMSFGSQGETAYCAYIAAAERLNIVGVNGEGGELQELFGRYPHHRGQQVASGRFGVCPEMLNSAYLIEIKVGQGAKPGEGGHLPGKKVSPKVARARNAATGIDLISPSNNHDIYSIEDLGQLIAELRACNPAARIGVKVPVVPNIGTIAVGIVKAGGDVITLSGYDGGTGAARTHALRFAGMPNEVGVVEAHRALSAAGLRTSVELWADGGLKTGRDVVKLMLLGADRCGFGTMAMVAAGCTICRLCQTDTCHVGIATQIETEREAIDRGLKRFVPREHDSAVERLCRFFTGVGEEIGSLTAQLGFRKTRDLVGRSDLLVQARGEDLVDLSDLIRREAGEAPPRAHAEGAIAAVPARGLQVLAPVCSSRALGTDRAGELARERLYQGQEGVEATLAIQDGIAGNGLAAFSGEGLVITVRGGAQDGVAKSALGGRVVILKGRNGEGRWIDGAVGKGFAYGAQRGRFFVQGIADARFCIRLSGAQVVAGARLTGPVAEGATLSRTAQLRGFAFEYMTAGEVVVLGDPGAWICAGMTGGTVYVRRWPQFALDEAALTRRLARGANVSIGGLDAAELACIRELLADYRQELEAAGQDEEAAAIAALAREAEGSFMAIRAAHLQVDQGVSTE